MKNFNQSGFVMAYNSFDFGWSWMELGVGIVLFILLFATDIFRSNNESRLKDPRWLSWLLVPVYLVH